MKRWSVTKQSWTSTCTGSLHKIEEGEMARKNGSGKRELIDTGTDKRYVRRDSKGQFDESDDQGRSLSKDVKRAAKTTVKAGQGDRGDQKRK